MLFSWTVHELSFNSKSSNVELPFYILGAEYVCAFNHTFLIIKNSQIIYAWSL